MTDEEMKRGIGRNISALRKARGYSVAEFGELMQAETGTPWIRQTVSALENGNRAYTITDLAAIAGVLQVTLADLVDGYFPNHTAPFDGSALIKAKIADTITELSRISAQI